MACSTLPPTDNRTTHNRGGEQKRGNFYYDSWASLPCHAATLPPKKITRAGISLSCYRHNGAPLHTQRPILKIHQALLGSSLSPHEFTCFPRFSVSFAAPSFSVKLVRLRGPTTTLNSSQHSRSALTPSHRTSEYCLFQPQRGVDSFRREQHDP
jgi:hypothetical protein